ncbi:hypothetical protein MG293_004489 [Ovis ammon polii]|uniref:Uncharacterized protein n=1 Tax=Ovis ammon polii TaxID=230172 RepID=A0AAD4UDN2_OVIAM|nr:hypothetical protein MG293_004489 [Ovis ammon polii]
MVDLENGKYFGWLSSVCFMVVMRVNRLTCSILCNPYILKNINSIEKERKSMGAREKVHPALTVNSIVVCAVLRSVGSCHRFRGSTYEPKMQRKKLLSYFHETMGKAVYTRSSFFCHKFDDSWCYTIFDIGIIYGKI